MEPTEYPGPHSGIATIQAERAGDVMATRELQVPGELGLLTDDVSRLQGLVDELEARLAGAGALRSAPEGKLLDTTLDELVPLADRIRGQAAADQVSGIFSRLEV